MEEKNDTLSLARLLAYNQIRDNEEFSEKEAELKALCIALGARIK